MHLAPHQRIVLVYIVIGLLWIYLSDRLLDLFDDYFIITWLQTIKGALFVAITATLLYVLIRHSINREQKINQALQESAQQYQSLVEISPFGIQELDKDGYIRYCNPVCQRTLGYSAEELIGKHVADLVPAERRDDLVRQIASLATASAPPKTVINQNLTKDGRLIDVKIDWNYKYNAQGEGIGYVVLLEDISEELRVRRKLEDSEYKYRTIIDNAPEGVWIIDANHKSIEVNGRLCELLGYTAAEMLGKSPIEFVDKENRRIFESQMARINSSFHRSYEIALRHKDGHEVYTHFSAVTLYKDNGDVMAAVAFVTDLSERKHLEDQLRQSATVFENTQEGVIITNEKCEILAVNRAFSEITGYTQQDVMGKTPVVLKSGRHDKDYYDRMWRQLSERGAWQGEIWNRRKNGEVYPEWLNISSVRSDTGQIKHYVGVFSDISQIKQTQEQLEYQAHHDPLTKLPNRLLMKARLEHAIEHASREKNHCAVLFIDLDRFKQINDSFGHSLGDKLLIEAAERMLNSVRGEDTLARMGGDEFVLIMEELEKKNTVTVVVEKILNILRKPFNIDDHELHISTCIGICIYPQDGNNAEQLLKNADAAMYEAKEKGASSYRFYSAEITHLMTEKLMLEYELRHAIQDNQFVLHYQPQVDLKTEKLIGLEALVRWQHPVRGMIPPGQFIPVAEESGLIVELGEWVLYHACNQAREWLDKEFDFGTIAVNIAGKQIEHGDLETIVRQVLQDTGLPAHRLELEITENFVMGQGKEAIQLLKNLCGLGVVLSIDDFGTGYSSLSYLKRMPIHKLKIDQSFVRELPNDENDVAISRAIIALGHSMQFTVIAEGVETEEQKAFLTREYCEQAQGYLFGYPQSKNELFGKWFDM